MVGKRILLTGSTGDIGKCLVQKLIKTNYKVAVVVRNLEKSEHLFSNKVEYISYTNHKFSDSIQDFNPHIVFHLASLSTSNDDKSNILELIDSNITFVSLLLDSLKNCNVELFINTGSFSEYHNNDDTLDPTYLYSATKIASRYMIDYFSKIQKFTFIQAILYTVYGQKTEHKKVIDYVIESLDANKTVEMSKGNQILDFIHVEDVINFFMQVLVRQDSLSKSFYKFSIGTGKGYTIREITDILEQITQKKAQTKWDALEPRKRDIKLAIANTKKVKASIGWEAQISITEGLTSYLKEIKYVN